MPKRAGKANYKKSKTPTVNAIYNYKWRKAAKAFASDKPFCNVCGKPAIVPQVDHIIPHYGNETLFWDESNWQVFAPTKSKWLGQRRFKCYADVATGRRVSGNKLFVIVGYRALLPVNLTV